MNNPNKWLCCERIVKSKDLTPFLLASLFIAAFIIRLYVSLYDLTRLAQICVADDAFYYFKLAKNIAAGLGSTFDGGVTRTNGYHPLYMLILIPIFKIFGTDPVTPVRIALIVLSIFNVLTALFIYKIIKRICSCGAAIWAAAIFLFNPYTIFVSLTGVEAAISTFFISAAAYQFILIKDKETADIKDHASLGALMGLSLLARTDSIIFCFFIFADRFISYITAKDRMKPLKSLIAMSAVIAALLLPWLAWNLINFHTIQQDSGKTIRFSKYETLKNAYPNQYKEAVAQARITRLDKGFTMLLIGNIPAAVNKPIHLIFLFLLLAALLIYLWREKLLVKYFRALYPVFLALGGIYFFYALYFLYIQTWYFMSSFFVFSLALGPAVYFIQQRLAYYLNNKILKIIFFTAAILILSLNFIEVFAFTWDEGFNRWQSLYIEASKYIEEKLPEDSRTGSFNSGIISYFTHKTVINLDGVVNHDIYDVIKNKTLMKYIREKKIDYIIDHNHELNGQELFSDESLFENMEGIGRLKSNHPKTGDVLILKVKK